LEESGISETVSDKGVEFATFFAYVAKNSSGVTPKDRLRNMKVEVSFSCIGQSYSEQSCLKLQPGYAQLSQMGYSVVCDDEYKVDPAIRTCVSHVSLGAYVTKISPVGIL